MDSLKPQTKNVKMAKNVKILKRLFFIVAVLIIIGGPIALLTVKRIMDVGGRRRPAVILEINRREIKAETAVTLEQQYQGLSDRPKICADCGMLFVFPDSGIKSFVMRNMNFPLDIIFIDNGTIKNIAANLEPEGSEPRRIYESAGPADRVLEVNGGYCERYNIKPGDKIWIK